MYGRSEGTFWKDEFGYLKGQWVFAATILGAAFVVAAVIAIAKPLKEASCNQQAEQIGVVDGDFRWLSATCYLTLDDGSVIPADRFRAVEGIES